ncbi:hypothetical protein RvY_04758 [Ramazzottius varieornatus]|uniref:Uncharacterized protein n=1 Tax=Ramazzottius varieornatus TaxID=947166 RepID=A0A1D1UVZ9_RAMVA|nr:hypothetical protein RvY_04758 [Ramazzottius varieornatus]
MVADEHCPKNRSGRKLMRTRYFYATDSEDLDRPADSLKPNTGSPSDGSGMSLITSRSGQQINSVKRE